LTKASFGDEEASMSSGRSEGTSNMYSFRPPAADVDLGQILRSFRFSSLPRIPEEGKICGWKVPAMLVSNVNIDSKQNVIQSSVYLNNEAEMLWGYSTAELYETTTQRDRIVRVQSPPSGCSFAPSINSLFHKDDISLFPRALIRLFVGDSGSEEAQFFRIINRYGEQVSCVAAVSYLFDHKGLPRHLALGVIPLSFLRNHRDFHEWISESRNPKRVDLHREPGEIHSL